MKNNALTFLLLVAIVALSSSMAFGQALGGKRFQSPSHNRFATAHVLNPDSALPAGVYTVGQAGSFPTIDSAFNKLNRDGILGNVTLTLIDTLYEALHGRRFELGSVAGTGPGARITIRPAPGTYVTVRGDSDAVFLFHHTKYFTLDGRSNPPSPSAGIFIQALFNPATSWNDCVDAWGDADYNEFLYLKLKTDDPRSTLGQVADCIGLLYEGANTPDNNLVEGNLTSGTIGIYVWGSFANRPQYNVVRKNTVGASSDLLGTWGITSEYADGTVIDGNTVQFLRRAAFPNLTIGINAYCNANTIIRNNVVHSLFGSAGAKVNGILGSGEGTYIGQGLQICNNMVYDLQNTSTSGNAYIGGIDTWYNNNVLVAYNTVVLSGTGANPVGTYALGYDVMVNNCTIRNNILVNLYHQTAGGHSTALWIYGNGTFTTDYNDLYVDTSFANSYTAYRSVGYRTLAAWQGAGYDPHSVSGLPHFREPYLHIDSTFATWLNGHATPIAGITTDFDGETRNAITPDIGADEFTGFTPTLRRVPSQYATIQSAINASAHGDTVLVSDGTYYENIRFKGKKIVVASTYATTGDTSHISNTIIDGSHATNPDSGSVVYFISGEDTNSVLCGFTVRGGSGTRLLAYNSVEGGGVLCMSGARLVQNMITGNNISGANIYGGGVAAEEGQMLIMEQNVVNGNRLNGGWAVGAGVGVYGMEGIIRGNIISDNTATSQGAGSASHGGGLWCEAGNFVVDDNLIARNKALAPNATQNPSYGGGFVAVNGNMDICNNRIVGNVIQSSGSMRAYGGGISLLAVSTSELGEMVVSGNYIASNTVIGGSSGALLSSGGGISSIDQRPWVNNNIIVKNSAPYGGGFGAIKYYTAGSSGDGPVVVKRGGDRTGTERAKRTPVQTRLLLDAPVLINNTIAYNRATVNGGAIASVGSWTPKVINTIAWGDTGMQEVYGGGVRVLFSNIQGGWPSDSGNIDVDPLFVDTTYRLSDYSSCIGAGRDSVLIGGVLYRVPSLCFYGSPRPNPAGSHPDIGACENPRAIPLTGVDDQPSSVPTAFALQQNYPNPFNPSTSISYQLPVAGQATLKVFDVLGREVATLVNEVKQPGTYSVQWNAPGMASGVYFYRLVAGEFQSIKKMIVLK